MSVGKILLITFYRWFISNFVFEEFGGDVNLGSNLDCGSVLHAAVKSNSPETVKFLLDNGADSTLKAFRF